MKLGKSQREKEQTKVASIAAVTDGGLVLIGRRGDTDKWNLPGGHFEPGEMPLEAAQRELKEETGLEGKNWTHIGFCDVREGLRVYSFLCEVDGDPSQSSDPDDEMVEFQWIDPKEDLPSEIADKLHNKKDVTLQFLGLQDESLDLIYDEYDGRDARDDIEDLCGKKMSKSDPAFIEQHPWKGEPLKVPKLGTDDRRKFDIADAQAVANNWAGGDMGRLQLVRVPIQSLVGTQPAVNKSRLKLYTRMLYANDQLPRVVVKRMGQGYHLLDGSHRMEAAQSVGQPHLDAYEILDAPMQKAMAGAVAGMMLGAAPMQQPPAQPEPKIMQAAQQAGVGKWTPEGMSSDLHPIAQLESSFGLHTTHEPNSQGEYHTAYGALGFKPVTAHEEYKKSKLLQQNYPNLKDPAEFMKLFQGDPKFYNLLASAHFERLKHRHGSPEAAAFAWRWGTGAASKADAEHIAKDMYVQKYKHMYLHQRQTQAPLGTPIQKMEHHDPLDAMLDHDDPRERILALKHHKVTPYHLRRGLYDEDPSVRAFAAGHPKMSEELLEEALKHKDLHTRLTAVRRPDLLDRHLEHVLYDPEVQVEVARHPALTEEQRQRMANNHEEVPEGLRMELMAKSIGYLDYPNLGVKHPGGPMTGTHEEHQKWLRNQSKIYRARTGEKKFPIKQKATAGLVLASFAHKPENIDPTKNYLYGHVDVHRSGLGGIGHEGQHMMFNAIRQKHSGKVGNAVVDRTLMALSPDDHKHLNRITRLNVSQYPLDQQPEEKLAFLHNYLMDRNHREKIHKDMKIHGDRNAEKISHDWAKQIWQKLRARANSMTPAEVGIIAKSEGERITDWKNDALEDGSADYNVYDDMLGFSPRIEQYIKAVQFLSGKEPDEEVFRRLLSEEGVDMEQAALNAIGMDDSEPNRAALRGVIEIQSKPLGKSEIDFRVHEVEAMMPDGDEVADAIRRGFSQDTEKPLDLKGKHSKGTLAVRDPKSGDSFLLKPGSGKQSPALGAREEVASQSIREGAFWHVAKLWGIGSRFPRADVVFIDGKEVAALHLLPYNWKNLEKLKRKGDGMFPYMALEKYRSTGELHRWAVLDWVCGNPDRHGQNLMVGPAKDGYQVALIDHGSAFAGDSFCPARDPSSFIPYYLRAWAAKDWKNLNPEARLRSMPMLAREKDLELKEWVERLSGDELKQLLHRYGINPDPSLRRLKVMKQAVKDADNASKEINKIWIGQ